MVIKFNLTTKGRKTIKRTKLVSKIDGHNKAPDRLNFAKQ